jgi:D-alanyl-D-alanine carboxypeptidase
MRLLLRLTLVTVLFTHYSFAQTRENTMFAPFDCREHSNDNELLETSSEDATESNTIAFFSSEPLITEDTTFGWKNWSLVENYSFGKDRGSLPMITDLKALHPFFRDKITQLIHECQRKGIQLAVVESYRTHAKQHEYKTMGKQYTNSNAGRSKHQYGLAVDVVPMINDVAIWNNTALWRRVGLVGEKLGLRWGGRWRKPYDPGHFEWTGGLPASSLYTGSFPDVPQCDERYPCLEEDLRILKKYWSEWETTQSSLTRK